MSGARKLFQDLDDSVQQTVRLGDGKILKVAGKGTIVIKLSFEKLRVLKDVQYVPKLAHNLLSVGQLMASGYTVEFADGECIIKDKDACTLLARAQMIAHRLFPLEADGIGSANVTLSQHELSKLWHQRYGHLNNSSLHWLS